MRFDIIGAGALGLLFGGKLAAAGECVTFWTRTAEQAITLAREGIRISEEGDEIEVDSRQFGVRVLSEQSEPVKRTETDWVFLMLKQTQIDTAFTDHLEKWEGPLNVVCFQNGMGHLEKLSRVMNPHCTLYSAVTTEGAKRLDSSKVVRSGKGETRIGILARRAVTEEVNSGQSLVDRMTKIMNTAGFRTLLSNDIERDIYRKLLINSVINPLTALWRVPNGELPATEVRRGVMKQLCEEGEAVLRAEGIDCGEGLFEQILSVCQSTKDNISSMLKDVQQGVATEIDYINGRFVEMAARSGVDVPGHKMICTLIRGLPDVPRRRLK